MLKSIDLPRYCIMLCRQVEQSTFALGFQTGVVERQRESLWVEGDSPMPRACGEVYESMIVGMPTSLEAPEWFNETHAAVFHRGFEAGTAAWDAHLAYLQHRWSRDPSGVPCPACGNRECRLDVSLDPDELGQAVCGGCGRRFVGYADPEPIVGPEAYANSPMAYLMPELMAPVD
jgi:hypothetical protein